MALTRHPSNEPHPLEGAVLRAFTEHEALDATSLSCLLAGCMFLRNQSGGDAMRAYRTVAEDVLGYMESQGKLIQRPDGWHHLKSVAPSATV
jgi:hypothetical protein